MSKKNREVLVTAAVLIVGTCICVTAFYALNFKFMQSVFGEYTGRQESPYESSARPLPDASASGILLPENVGAYTRGGVTTDDNDLMTTTYTGPDGATVVAHAQVWDSRAEALAAVQALYDASDDVAAVRHANLQADPSWLAIWHGDGSVVFVWGHDRYYWGVEAADRDTLDDFMAGFPY